MTKDEFNNLNADLITLYGSPGKSFLDALYRRINALHPDDYHEVIEGIISTFKPRFKGDFPSPAHILDAVKTNEFNRYESRQLAASDCEDGQSAFLLLLDEVHKLPSQQLQNIHAQAEMLLRSRTPASAIHWLKTCTIAWENGLKGCMVEIYCEKTGKQNPLLKPK